MTICPYIYLSIFHFLRVFYSCLFHFLLSKHPSSNYNFSCHLKLHFSLTTFYCTNLILLFLIFLASHTVSSHVPIISFSIFYYETICVQSAISTDFILLILLEIHWQIIIFKNHHVSIGLTNFLVTPQFSL